MTTRKRQQRTPHDLDPYQGCPADQFLGILPLAVGFLGRNGPFETGKMPAAFPPALLPYCQPSATVCHIKANRPCPLCNQLIAGYGSGELRAIGDEELYAAPDLLHHYVTAHHYRPPDEFIDAILHGPGPDTAEHRALRLAYQ